MGQLHNIILYGSQTHGCDSKGELKSVQEKVWHNPASDKYSHVRSEQAPPGQRIHSFSKGLLENYTASLCTVLISRSTAVKIRSAGHCTGSW